MTVLPSCEYIELRCPDIEGKRIEMIAHQGEGRCLGVDWYQLLRQEHRAGESLASEGSILSSCTGGRDATQQKNRIEISETSALEV
jgi:hypothetical protein